MNITSHTTTQTEHRTTLAGGISVTLAPACFGATLTLSAPGLALTLALTPDQVAEMTTWEHDEWQRCECTPTRHTRQVIFAFVLITNLTRAEVGRSDAVANGTYRASDIATLRALARAYQETQP